MLATKYNLIYKEGLDGIAYNSLIILEITQDRLLLKSNNSSLLEISPNNVINYSIVDADNKKTLKIQTNEKTITFEFQTKSMGEHLKESLDLYLKNTNEFFVSLQKQNKFAKIFWSVVASIILVIFVSHKILPQTEVAYTSDNYTIVCSKPDPETWVKKLDLMTPVEVYRKNYQVNNFLKTNEGTYIPKDKVVFEDSPNFLIIKNKYAKREKERKLSEDKKVFLGFQNKIFALPKQCDSDYSLASSALDKSNPIDAYLYFETASDSCSDASDNITNIEIPSRLDDNLQKKLTNAKEELSTAYLFKHLACKDFRKYFETQNIKDISSAKENLNTYQSKLLLGVAYLTEVKVALKIK